MTRIFIPRDAAALAVGADEVARVIEQKAQERGAAVEIVRTGSRGMFWLEPLIEVETPSGRCAFGPVKAADIDGLFDADFLTGGASALSLGDIEQHPWLKSQRRLLFSRCGIVDPLSLRDYLAHGGGVGLARAFAMGPAEACEEIVRSGLRGRGGAGFPAGVKWKTVREAEAPQKYVVCNADEGDSGTFADRMILEGDPFMLIEGMLIAGFSVGASKGYVYSRSEYPNANAVFAKALDVARTEGQLGPHALGENKHFDIELRVGAGAYVCGEETALLESLEGRRGQVRVKPPLPAHRGLFGKPTIVNNVLSLATAPWILAHGAAAYAAYGVGRSRGTMPVQLSGNVKHAGLYECEFGVTLGDLVHRIGGGTRSGRPVKAVQVGGPLGAYFPPELFDTPFDYEAFTDRGGLIGHGGVVVFDDTVDMRAQARFAFEFCALESCGKCTPCRIGSVRGMEEIDKLVSARDAGLINDLCETLKFGSLCALGGFTPYPVLSALKYFPEDFDRTTRGVLRAAVR